MMLLAGGEEMETIFVGIDNKKETFSYGLKPNSK